jgi:hypothetical protein
MPADRRVHAVTAERWEIVRYDRASKWFVEYKDTRTPITFDKAVWFARRDGATANLGLPGGARFDAAIRRASRDSQPNQEDR